MHVLVLVHALPCHRRGGLEFATAAACEGLIRRGHTLHVVTTPQVLQEPGHLATPRLMLRACGWELVPPHVLTIEAVGGRPAHPSPSFWRAVRRRALALLREGDDLGRRPDAIVAVDMAAMFLPAPYLLQLHGTLLSETTLDRGFRAFRRQFPWWPAVRRHWARVVVAPWWRAMVRRADGILVDSRFILDRVEALLGGGGAATAAGGSVDGRRRPRVHLVPLALGPTRRALTRVAHDASGGAAADAPAAEGGGGGAGALDAFSPARPLRLLSVGRLEAIKGFEVVVSALERFVEVESPPFVWSVAGPEPTTGAPLHEVFEGLRGRPWFRHLGEVSDEALAAAYREHDYLLNLEYNQPAFGLVVLEAMTAGCTPVVSQRGALPELVTPWNKAELLRHHAMLPGYTLRAGDVVALANFVRERLALGPGHLATQRAITRDHAATFRFDHWMEQLEQHLGEHAVSLAAWKARRGLVGAPRASDRLSSDGAATRG